MSAGLVDEARRQARLLAAIASGTAVDSDAAGLRETGGRARRGLVAYRANAFALAERALGAVFPTVRAMVGDAPFRTVAAGLWRDDPPQRGDLGEWGEGFAAWIERQPDLAEWPWLADSARLDGALHRCERAADAVLDAASLRRLDAADPAAVRLVLAPGTARIASRHPIVTIRAAHRDGSDPAFERARAALAAGEGECAFVVRSGWRAQVRALTPPESDWIAALLAGRSLANALAAAGPGFDFAEWFANALRAGWLKGSAASSDPCG